MNYTKTNWENNKAPAINATHLNNIEDGIYNAHAVLSSLPDSMKFKGTVGVGADVETLPTEASEGDVYMVMTTKTYSPGGVAKKGDLFIYTNSSWKLIPSGDDGLGTVTSITAGAGLSITGGQITSDGQISIDASYTAQSGTDARNGLMSSEDKKIIENLSKVATSGSYNDLSDQPIVPAIEHSTGNSQKAVISQAAVTELLNGKANSSHTHEQSDIVELENTLNGKSSITHSHGAITKEGKLLNDSGEIVDSNTFLYTLLDGTISSISGIPFDKVDKLGSNFEARDKEISKIKSVLPTDGEDVLVDVAPSIHSHDDFTETSSGFVPTPPETGASSSVLFGDGSWKQIATNPITEEENLFIDYSTSAPTEDNIDGLKIVILDSEPKMKHKGYLYLISEA